MSRTKIPRLKGKHILNILFFTHVGPLLLTSIALCAATGCVAKEAFLTCLLFCEMGYVYPYWPFLFTHEQEFYLPFLFIFALLFPLYVIEVYFYFKEINLY